MSLQILFLMNHAGAPPGILLRITRDIGARSSIFLPLHELSFDPDVPARLPDDSGGCTEEFTRDFDGLVILGGAIGVNDTDRYPYIQAICRLIRAFGQTSRPVLGVCLGAQMIASAYGARVFPSPEFEFGFSPLSFLPASYDDPLVSGFQNPLYAMQWHRDSFDLPEGAVHLMSGRVPAQAFRLDEYVYGFQFHFEVNEAIFRHWCKSRAYELDIPEQDFLEQQEESWRTHQPRQEEFAHAIMTRWLDFVAERKSSSIPS